LKILKGASTDTPEKEGIMNFIHIIISHVMAKSNSSVFYHHNVRQLLWGYEDKFLDLIQSESIPENMQKKLNISIPKNLNTFIQLQV